MSSQEDIVLGPYELRATLGRGASAIVYRAYDAERRREVALKIASLPPEAISNRARFVRAAELWATIRSPYVVRVYEYGEFPRWGPYLSMEYVRGEDLSHLLSAEGRLDVERAVRLTRQIIQALKAAHDKGVLHRDIKPDNIIVTADNSGEEIVKVTDFGIAKQASDHQGHLNDAISGPLTTHGQLLGTPRYMAPEQVDASAVSPRSDLYSTGLVLYELLTGQVAVQGGTIQALLLRQLDADPIINPMDPDVPVAFRMVLARSTAKDPNARYANAEQFLMGLDAALAQWRHHGDMSSLAEGLPNASQPGSLSGGRTERLSWSSHSGQRPESRPTPPAQPPSPPRGGFVAGVLPTTADAKQSKTQAASAPTLLSAGLKVGLVLLILVGLLGAGVWLGQETLLFRPPEFETQYPISLGQSGWKRQDFTSAAGTRLVGYYGPAKGRSIAGTVVYVHGMHQAPEQQAARLAGLRDAGLNVFVFGHRGYGGSEGETTGVPGLVADSVKAFDWASVRSYSGGQNMYVYGYGLGGAVAAEVSLKRPVSGIILERTPTSLADRVREATLGLPVDLLLQHPFDTAQALERTTVPVLLLHGEDDSRIPAEHSRRLSQIGTSFKMLHIVPGAGDDIIATTGVSQHAQVVRNFITTAPAQTSDQPPDP
ncbi:MAG: protein kinase [Myxococcota bacterium]